MTPPGAGSPRVLSGVRPTGPLHLGHLVGALENWVSLQDAYDCYYFIADWHALTTEYENPGPIREFTLQIVADWLAAGLDPDRSTLFVQSDVPQHAELQLLLGMITPVSWLERVPTYKEQQRELAGKDLSSFGFLGYPVVQAADILVYRAHAVPVGEDQVSHLEVVREIARRFNHLYGEVFPEPQPLLTPAARLPGTDGRKMSKSYGNALWLSEDEKSRRDRLRTMVTDPARRTRKDPGNPDVCPVYDLHEVFSAPDVREWAADGCRSAGIGCIECKMAVADAIDARLRPHRERRERFASDPEHLARVLREGAARAREAAEATMVEVRRAMRLRP